MTPENITDRNIESIAKHVCDPQSLQQYHQRCKTGGASKMAGENSIGSQSISFTINKVENLLMFNHLL